MKEFITTREEIRTEYIVEKSKFIITVAPVQTEGEAQEFIKRVSKEFWDASHNCTAFVIGPNQEQQRSSDNGEPSGTAGKPILEVLKKREITNTAIVVTRYFGGIKLGAGGLIRAYAGTTAEGVKAAGLVERLTRTKVTLTVDYKQAETLQYWLTAHDYQIMTTTYDTAVHLVVPVAEVELPEFQATLTDFLAGNIKFQIGEKNFFEISIK